MNKIAFDPNLIQGNGFHVVVKCGRKSIHDCRLSTASWSNDAYIGCRMTEREIRQYSVLITCVYEIRKYCSDVYGSRVSGRDLSEV